MPPESFQPQDPGLAILILAREPELSNHKIRTFPTFPAHATDATTTLLPSMLCAVLFTILEFTKSGLVFFFKNEIKRNSFQTKNY